MLLFPRSACELPLLHFLANSLLSRKKAVSSQTSELEALEARLRATEERLRKAGLSPSTPTNSSFANARSSPSSNGRSSPRPRPSIGDDTYSPTKTEGPKSPLGTEFKRTQMNDGKAVAGGFAAQNMPGALPPTPGASEGESDPEPEPSESEYVDVSVRAMRTRADLGQDGDIAEHH
jgi:hypothetical protein